MKPTYAFSSVLVLAATVTAQDISTYVKQIPACMNACFSSLFTEFKCNNNDWKCLCTSPADITLPITNDTLTGQSVLTAFAFAVTQECRDADNNCDADNPLLGTNVDTADLALVSICEAENGQDQSGLDPAESSDALTALAAATSLLAAAGTSASLGSVASSLAAQLTSVLSSAANTTSTTASSTQPTTSSIPTTAGPTSTTASATSAAASSSSSKAAAPVGMMLDDKGVAAVLGAFLLGIFA